MNEEFNFNKQNLGVLIDDSVDSATLNWIGRISEGPLIRSGVTAFREVDADIKNLANRFLTGEVDVFICLTSGGFDYFFERASRVTSRQRLIDALNDMKTIAVGSLVASRLHELGIEPELKLLQQFTWRDLLVSLDSECPVANLSVALETTQDVHSLSAGLEARGATVTRLDPVSFKQADASADEQDLLDAIEDEHLATLLLPNPVCAARFAAIFNRRQRPMMSDKLKQLVVLGIGRETEEALIESGLTCDIVVSQNQIETEMTQTLKMLYAAKAQTKNKNLETIKTMDVNAAWYDSPFMKALRKEPVDVTPVWMMRQAGRYMQEYREVRAKTPFLDLCRNPQLCSEVMCTAVNRLGVDAAIIFSDLLPILVPLGFDLEFVAGDGPVIHNPIRKPADIDRVKPLANNDELQFVMDTVSQTRADLPAKLPLIGFAGAPFSLASYLIEGGATRNYALTKQLMFTDGAAWDELMSRLTTSIVIYLKGQIEAGAQCIQLFDSWAGCLGVHEYRTYVLPYVSQVITQISPLAPVINFATGNPALLPELATTSAQAIGVDWRIPLDVAWKSVGHDRAVQGNLDPTVLLSTPGQIREKVSSILEQAAGRPGHIFNLGHGILPQTPVENAIALVDIVHEISDRK